jgi:hypothetical protein
VSREFHLLLTDRQHALLTDEADRSGLPMAELIRRAVDRTYRRDARASVRGVELSLGVWRKPDAAVAGRRAKTLDGRRF